MISHNAGLTASHPYQSGPIEWPFLIKGISFWTQNDTRKQIYLISNPFGTWLAIGSIAVIVGISGADVLSRRRGFYPLNQGIGESTTQCMMHTTHILNMYLTLFVAC